MSKVVIGYFTSWTAYRPDNGKFQANDVDPSLLTHINYAFVGLSGDNKVQILDDWEFNGLHERENLMKLKKRNPNLKILVSMGGWNEGSQKYSQMASNSSSRKVFVNDVLQFVKKYGFDGFDLDWEYPCKRGGSPNDKENFVLLLKELSSALRPHGLLLTVAVSAGQDTIDLAYDVPSISKIVDYINVMSYDFHGAYDNCVGHNAPLYASHLDKTALQKVFNAGGIKHWLARGANPRKLVMGLPTYARTFTLANPNNTNLYAPINGPGEAGPYTREAGILGYNEILSMQGKYAWDDEQKVPHMICNGNQWIGYDDEKSLQLKVRFGNSLNLAGYMIWSLDTDDFRGTKGTKYPLLKAINKAL